MGLDCINIFFWPKILNIAHIHMNMQIACLSLYILARLRLHVCFRMSVSACQFCMSVSACQFLHVNFCMSVSARQFLHVSFCTSVSARQFLHVSFCTSVSARQFLHVSFCTSVSACQFLHVSFCMSVSASRCLAQSTCIVFCPILGVLAASSLRCRVDGQCSQVQLLRKNSCSSGRYSLTTPTNAN